MISCVVYTFCAALVKMYVLSEKKKIIKHLIYNHITPQQILI